jgi:hypothetical protein
MFCTANPVPVIAIANCVFDSTKPLDLILLPASIIGISILEVISAAAISGTIAPFALVTVTVGIGHGPITAAFIITPIAVIEFMGRFFMAVL